MPAGPPSRQAGAGSARLLELGVRQAWPQPAPTLMAYGGPRRRAGLGAGGNQWPGGGASLTDAGGSGPCDGARGGPRVRGPRHYAQPHVGRAAAG
eukprot:11158968-Lingulodinium_polyedra.AAC.2